MSLLFPTPAPVPQACRSLLPADMLAREAQFVVTIGNVRGVMDTSILDPEPGPDGPFISYSYYVTYDFVEDEEGERNAFASAMAEMQPDSVLAEVWPCQSGGAAWASHRPACFCVHTEQLFSPPPPKKNLQHSIMLLLHSGTWFPPAGPFPRQSESQPRSPPAPVTPQEAEQTFPLRPTLLSLPPDLCISGKPKDTTWVERPVRSVQMAFVSAS